MLWVCWVLFFVLYLFIIQERSAATVFVSPDGSEHFIAYLRNFSPTVVRPLQTCIDRIRFVKNPNGGADLLEICGPSVNAQPLPSGMDAPTVSDYQYARFHW